MKRNLSPFQLACALGACAAAGALYWVTSVPVGFLLPIIILLRNSNHRFVWFVSGMFAVAAIVACLLAFSGSTNPLNPAAQWAVLLITGLGVTLAIAWEGSSEALDEQIPDVSREKNLGLVHPEDLDIAHQATSRAFWSGFPQIIRHRSLQPDGSYQWTEFRAEPGYTIAGDTPAKVSAQHLPWSAAGSIGETGEAARIALVFETIFGTGWAMDTTGRFTYATPNAQTTIGQTLEQMNEQLTEQEFLDGGDLGWKRIFHPDEYERVATSLRHSLKTGEHWNNEYRLRRFSTGEYGWHRVAMRPTRGSDGRVTGWYGMSIDITVYKETEAALRIREQELTQLVNMLPIHIMRFSGNGRPIFFSKATLCYFDLGDEYMDQSESVLATMSASIHSDDKERVQTALRHALLTADNVALRYRLRRCDGAYRWMDTRAEAIRDKSGIIVEWYAVSLDVHDQVLAQDELRLAHEELAHASQTANLAELSASIAHEVSQPLTALLSSSEACQRWLSLEPPNVARAQQSLERIIRSGNSAREIISRIRALFAQSNDNRQMTDLPRLINDARDLLAEELSKNRVKFEFEAEKNLPLLMLDRIQVQQAFINFMRNGIDAISSTSQHRLLRISVTRKDDVVETAISDTGCGVESPLQIFEPFFTTKAQGMGMGLAICRSIIVSHGGDLWVEKNEHHGATFIFTLPIVNNDA